MRDVCRGPEGLISSRDSSRGHRIILHINLVIYMYRSIPFPLLVFWELTYLTLRLFYNYTGNGVSEGLDWWINEEIDNTRDGQFSAVIFQFCTSVQ